MMPCPDCNGHGWKKTVIGKLADGNEEWDIFVCPTCNGKGKVMKPTGHIVITIMDGCVWEVSADTTLQETLTQVTIIDHDEPPEYRVKDINDLVFRTSEELDAMIEDATKEESDEYVTFTLTNQLTPPSGEEETHEPADTD